MAHRRRDITALPGFPRDQVHDDVLRALNRPAASAEGWSRTAHGWPIGRAVQLHEVAAALARIPGVDMAEEVTVQLFPADPSTGERSQAVDGSPWRAMSLSTTYRHSVRVR